MCRGMSSPVGLVEAAEGDSCVGQLMGYVVLCGWHCRLWNDGRGQAPTHWPGNTIAVRIALPLCLTNAHSSAVFQAVTICLCIPLLPLSPLVPSHIHPAPAIILHTAVARAMECGHQDFFISLTARQGVPTGRGHSLHPILPGEGMQGDLSCPCIQGLCMEGWGWRPFDME